MGEVEKSLGKLAEEINAEHRACEAALRSGLRHAVRAGELLTEAKGQVKHGEWGTRIRPKTGRDVGSPLGC
jgi:predicted transcriptional regulator